MKRIFLLKAIVYLTSCNQTKLDCSNQNTKELIFLKDSISLKLPVTWNKIDSSRFFNKASVIDQTIMSDDKLGFVYILVSDYAVYKNVKLNPTDFFLRMKAKMEERPPKDSLIEEKVKKINGHQVQFLKYLRVDNKQYNAHIGFILPEKRQVEIEIRVTGANEKDSEKVLDCIFSSLHLK